MLIYSLVVALQNVPNHIHSQLDYTGLMNEFWCPLVADWLDRNDMDCFFRTGISKVVIATTYLPIYVYLLL